MPDSTTSDVGTAKKGCVTGLVRSSSAPVVQDGETRDRLIRVATRLFAERGFDGVSIRQITGEANANLGAVNYHFKSKEGLIREVFGSLARPVNEARLSELDRYEAEAGSEPLDLQHVAYALIAPAIRFASRTDAGGYYLFRLIVLARTLPSPFVGSVVSQEYDKIFGRFVSAISRALPMLSREEVCWRYSFAIGALLHVIGYFDGYDRMRRLSNGVCDVTDVEGLIDHLVTFVAAGLRGSDAGCFPVDGTLAAVGALAQQEIAP